MSDEQKKPTRSKANRLLDYAQLAGVEPWSTPEGHAYIDVRDQTGRLWCAPVRSGACSDWLIRLMIAHEKSGVGTSAVDEAQGTLEAIARAPDGRVIPAHIRLAWSPEAVRIDMGRTDWRIIEVTAEGWEILNEMPEGVRFRRPPRAQEMPEPVRTGGGGWAKLQQLMGVSDTDDPAFVLCVAWMLGALSGGPYTLLALTGEQGSGKSTVADVLRSVVDPHLTGRRQPPKTETDLGSAANNTHAICFDNVSTVQPWLSDALAALLTGRAYAARKLYSDFDEASVSARRPIIITSIPAAVTRDDLADRALAVELPAIPEDLRLGERELRALVEESRPLILGDLLDAVAAAIRYRDDTPQTGWPRMADFARWVAAAEFGRALPWPRGTFARVYQEARDTLTDTVLEADPIGLPLLEFIEGHPDWEGTTSDLLRLLTECAHNGSPPKDWPTRPEAFGNHLRRLAPALRRRGWEIVRSRDNSARTKRFRRVAVEKEAPEAVGEFLDRIAGGA